MTMMIAWPDGCYAAAAVLAQAGPSETVFFPSFLGTTLYFPNLQEDARRARHDTVWDKVHSSKGTQLARQYIMHDASI